jgi:hypothetical protein
VSYLDYPGHILFVVSPIRGKSHGRIASKNYGLSIWSGSKASADVEGRC